MSKAIIVRLDAGLAKELERRVPARARGQSRFIREAIRKALWDLEEIETRRAYERLPQDEPVFFDPKVFEPEDWDRPSGRGRTRR